MNRVHVMVLLSITALVFGLVPALAGAGAEDDAKRIERKFEIRKLAREIFDRADNRAKEAAKRSKTIQKNNEVWNKGIIICYKEATKALKAITKGELSAMRVERIRVQSLLLECLRGVQEGNPNADIIKELRDEFIGEELEALRDMIEAPRRKELEEEIQELSD